LVISASLREPRALAGEQTKQNANGIFAVSRRSARPGVLDSTQRSLVRATIAIAVAEPVNTAASLTRVLVVEDDPDIADLVRRYLQKNGFEVEVRNDGREALEEIARRTPDLLVLDLMLPQVNGLDVCRRLRADPKTAAVPIIMVTARAEESERIAGLDLGADDYVAKPFSPGELVARVRALLRRTARTFAAGDLIAYGPLSVDTAQHTVTSNGQEVVLTAKEFLLLQYLLRNRGRVLSRNLLLTDVWGYTYTGGTRTVDVHVRRLREKLPLLEHALVTVKQFGYRLLEQPPDAP
jgi:DNA-binding response OmpR family regulator